MKKLRFLSVVLTLCMLFSFSAYAISPTDVSEAAIATTTQAQAQPQELTVENTDSNKDISLGVGELTLEQLGLLSVEDTELHEKIDIEQAQEKGHVNRLYEQENDLHTIIYQNKDGSKTSYIFANPVKYVDSEGNIRDKSTKITASTDSRYEYAMEDNNVKAYFSEEAKDGIALTAAEYKITMKPMSSASGEKVMYISDSNSVTYAQPFGKGTSLIYRTTFSGIKEDIVLSSYTGANTFEFDLGVTGLTPKKTDGIWTLVNDKDEVIATFSEIITTDANGKMIVGTLDITAINGGYKMTVTVPEAYLTSPGTVYPVYIDPTINFEEDILETYTGVYNEFSGQPAIIDVNMYSTAHSDTVNTYGVNELGGTNPEGRLIIKLPSFYQDKGDGYIDLNRDQIGSVTLNMYAYAAAGTVITSRALGATWNTAIYGEDPVYLGYISNVWSGYGSDDDYPVVNTTLTGTGWASFDITEYVRNWAYCNTESFSDDYWDPANGIMFFASSACSFDATENSSFNNDMYVTIDYSYVGGDYYIYNNTYYKLMSNNNGTIVTTTTTGTTAAKWYISYLGDNKHIIYSAATTKLLGVSGNSLVFASYGAKTEPANQWTIALLIGSQGYTFTNVSTGQTLYYNGSSFGVSTATTNNKWGMLPYDEYVAMTDVSLEDDWVQVSTSKNFYLSTTPANASWSDESMFSWAIADTDIISSSASNPALITGRTSGYTVLVLTHKITGFQKSVVVKCGILPDGEYKIFNKASTKYMSIEHSSQSVGANIEQQTNSTNTCQNWALIMNADGTYAIQSLYSGHYVTVKNSSTLFNAAIVQDSNISAAGAKWIITQTDSGAYRITPSQVASFAICVPDESNSSGTNLLQMIYLDNNSYYDEWVFDNASETQGITNGAVYNIKGVNSNKVFNVYNGETSNGTNVTQYTLDTTKQWQSWCFIYVGNGDYKIKDINSGKLLTVSSDYYSEDFPTSVETYIWEDNINSKLQLFKIIKNTDGTYTFLSKCSGYGSALEVENNNTGNAASIIMNDYTGAGKQKFILVESNTPCPSVVVPCVYGMTPSYYPNVVNFPVYLEQYVSQYESILENARWKTCDNGFITFNSSNMTVTAIDTGVAWLEAYDNGRLAFICYVYSENILASFDQNTQEYLYLNGTFIGDMSCQLYEQDPSVDPLILRTEWYLCAITLHGQGKTDDEIMQTLRDRFGIYPNDFYSWDVFIGEILVGYAGGYNRENLTLSFDGLRALLDFYWLQYASYQLVNLDTVNIYTPATQQDVIDENAVARRILSQARNSTHQINDSISSINYVDKTYTTAVERNAIWASRGYTDTPYVANSLVAKIKTSGTTRFVRVYNSSANNFKGSWIMKADDIVGLTPTQIKNKYALPNVPNMICDVIIPSDTDLYVGIAASNSFGTGGNIQFEIQTMPLEGWFSNFRSLS